MTPQRRMLGIFAAIMLAGFFWSLFGPADRGTWAFEILPGTLALSVVVLTYGRFPFSTFVYLLVMLQYLLLCQGAHYTYAQEPICGWISEQLGWERNHFDRVGHFVQGVVPAMICRELLVRVAGMRRGHFLFWAATSMALAFSGFYEILEVWVVLLFYPDAGPAWLGHQGDPFDAQWDMTMALSGALLAQLVLGRLHDRSMADVQRATAEL